MTRPKSDAQLDAEAAAQAPALRWLIIDLRKALLNESPSRINGRQIAASVSDPLSETDEGGIGPPLSAGMHRFLGSSKGRHQRRWDLSADPRVRPAMASITDLSEWCGARHSSHLVPYSTRSLCAQMVYEVGYLGQEPDDVAWLHNLELEKVEDMLLKALRHAWLWRNDVEARLSREPGNEAPLPERHPYRPAA